MALGEAFITVRADAKPFAKDLEKGLKTILEAAERKLAADPSVGQKIKTTLADRTSSGVSEGLQRGFREGTRKGAREALTLGQKFFAALGDFADDGLSAIPSKVKASLVIAILGAGTVIAPLLASTISASIVSGVSLGVTGLGVIFASQLKPVRDQFTALGAFLLDQLRGRAQVFTDPLLQAAVDIQRSFNRVGDTIGRTFAQAAEQIEPLTRGLTGFLEQFLPQLEIAVRRARPLIEALGQALPQLGRDLGLALRILADGSAQSSRGLRDFLFVVGQVSINVATMIRLLSDAYFAMRVLAATASGDVALAVQLMTERENAARIASGQLTTATEELNTALSTEAAEANAARLAITPLISALFDSIDGTIQFEQAIDDLTESIKNGNRSFDVRNEKGRENLRLVEQAIAGAARERDAEIARAAETGRSIEEINAAYSRQIAKIEEAIGSYGRQDTKLKELFETAKKVPDVNIKVETPGMAAALARMRNLARLAFEAAKAGADAVKSAGGGAGLRTATQYALGGIVDRPTFAQLGEAGYKEAVIPDPSVMPQRAMELSNQFGLTDLIANSLSSIRPVVNVFIGSQRLDDRIDYRIGFNNQFNAMAMVQGPRGA